MSFEDVDRALVEVESEMAAERAMLENEGFFTYTKELAVVNKIQSDDELLCAIRIDLSKLVDSMDATVPWAARFKNTRDVGLKINKAAGIGYMYYWLSQLRNYKALFAGDEADTFNTVLCIVNNAWNGIGKWQS